MPPQAGVAAVEAVYVTAVLEDPRFSAVVLTGIVAFEVVGVALADRNLRRWRSWAADEEQALRAAEPVRSGRAETVLRLLRALLPETVVLGMRQRTKGEVIEAPVDRAAAVTDEPLDRGQALQILREREDLAPTGVGHGVAIPHCRLMGLERPVLVLGRHEEGVVFGGVDDTPCRIVLLILSSARDPSQHLRLLAAAAHVFVDAATREALFAADTPGAVLAVLQALTEEEGDGAAG